MLVIGHKRTGVALGMTLLLSLAQAQVPVSFDSVAGIPWDMLTVDQSMSLFPEAGRLVEGPPGRAYLLGGGCVSTPGYSYLTFQRTGVVFVFNPPRANGAQKLVSIVVSQQGSVVTPEGIDIGDEITPQSNSDGTGFRIVRRFGGEFLEVFDRGVFYYCLPASLRRVEKGKAFRVRKISIREDYSP